VADGDESYSDRIKRALRRVLNKDKPDAKDIEEERVLSREKRRMEAADAQERIDDARYTRTNRRILLIFLIVFLTVVTSVCLCIVILNGMGVISVTEKTIGILFTGLVGSIIGLVLVVTKGLYPRSSN
jgi:hypothetical protein